MAGWDKQRVQAFKLGLADFIKHVVIFSKEEVGEYKLELYLSQKRFLNEVFEGLERDIHSFVVLKARQLGISTVVRVLIVYWAYVHRGLRVSLIYDTESNKEDARQEIKLILDRLPPSHRIPIADGGDNRQFLQFENGSRISFMVAGIKKGAGSGGLGRSRGLNCVGATEISSWVDIEGLRALERSLAQEYPDRLYIWESTARSFNIFYDLWEEAKQDELTKKAIFIGWWGHPLYRYETGSPLFEKYGTYVPTVEEAKKIDEVKEFYNVEVTMEQLAWYRHAYDPNVDGSEREHAGQDIIMQELPWTEFEAFLRSGNNFFPNAKLTILTHKAKEFRPTGYRYFMSEDFFATVVEQTRNLRTAHLKVWEEPDPSGVYSIGCDPAFGSDDDADRHAIQILRCYADGVDQVAEYCTTEGTTQNLAWVLLHLCGAYGGQTKGARFILELNGPGNAVWGEIKSMRTLLKSGYLQATAKERGLTNIGDNVRDFLWSKDDTLSQAPTAFHFETSTKRKVTIMERLRDFVNLGQIGMRSEDCIREMEKMVRNGDQIKGEGSTHDDRVIALALAVRAWETHERKMLINQQRTRENERRRADLSGGDLSKMFNERIVQSFFHEQNRTRIRQARAARRGSRWSW